jgi:hypothetical protein
MWFGLSFIGSLIILPGIYYFACLGFPITLSGFVLAYSKTSDFLILALLVASIAGLLRSCFRPSREKQLRNFVRVLVFSLVSAAAGSVVWTQSNPDQTWLRENEKLIFSEKSCFVFFWCESFVPVPCESLSEAEKLYAYSVVALYRLCLYKQCLDNFPIFLFLVSGISVSGLILNTRWNRTIHVLAAN